MKKIILTSTGLENVNIKTKFIEMLDTDIKNVKVLFIITAANDPDALRVLPSCLDDLTNCGIVDANIKVYDMYELISQEEINTYNAIYVCGGSTEYLASRMREIKFRGVIDEYLNRGGVYLGVSAGSVCASGEYKGCLDFIKNKLDVHRDDFTSNGIITDTRDIFLSDEQALIITDDKLEIIS